MSNIWIDTDFTWVFSITCSDVVIDNFFGYYFPGESSFQQSEDSSEPHMNFPRSSNNRQRTIESMIVVEKVMTKFYGVDQIKKYVPTIVNMVW